MAAFFLLGADFELTYHEVQSMQPRTRRVQRIHLAQPIVARLGASRVALIDISILGVRIEHHTPLVTGSHSHLSFVWDGEEIAAECRIVRSRLERFSVGADGLTVYHSGIEFMDVGKETKEILKQKIGIFIARALHEQKLNARGLFPESVEKIPTFRPGQPT